MNSKERLDAIFAKWGLALSRLVDTPENKARWAAEDAEKILDEIIRLRAAGVLVKLCRCDGCGWKGHTEQLLLVGAPPCPACKDTRSLRVESETR